MLPGRAERGARGRGRPVSDEPHPARAAADRRARGGAGGARRCARGCSPSGPRLRRVRGRRSPSAWAPSTSRRSPAARRRCTWPSAPRASSAGDEVVTTPVQLRGLGQLPALRGRRAGLLRHRPAHAEHRPGGRRGGGGRPHDRPAAGAHLRLPGRHAGLRAAGRRARAVDRRGRVRGARRRARRRHAGGRARQPRHLRLLPQQAADHGGGGSAGRRPAPRSRSGSTASATRAARPTWAGSTTTGSGFNYRLSDIACALGLAQLERLDEMLAARARVAALYGEALAGVEGLDLPCPDADGDRRSWFVYVVQLPPRRRPRRHDPRLRERGHRHQALPARDPPDELLPRALRPPRGRVPRVRGRGRPLAGAAVLPGAHRGPGRARGRDAARACSAQLLQQRHATRQPAERRACRPPPRSPRSRTARGPACCRPRCRAPPTAGRGRRAWRSASASSARATPRRRCAAVGGQRVDVEAVPAAARAPSARWRGRATARAGQRHGGMLRSVVRRKRWARGVHSS